MRKIIVMLVLFAVGNVFAGVDAPKPYGVLPSEAQLKWHETEFYCFIHFTINTFTDREWGGGEESPKLFNPSAFDADQIVSTAKISGMKGLILTCKHHDGFCLWPSKYTEHSVKNSPYKAGKGDVVKEFADACKKHKIKFGVYLSPWDRNHADYAKPEYVDYYRRQLKELLTEYGPVFEVWWDGANGGSGYYGGAKETRHIDRTTYYDWDNTMPIVNELQPDAVIFSDVGPGCRWVGNEHGYANDPCWSTITFPLIKGKKAGPGSPIKRELLGSGVRNGKYWIPAEVDVSIRPGWFYHKNQDDRVRTPANIANLYYQSVGRGASLLLNLPPDRRGLIHENDVKALKGFRKIMDDTFKVNLVRKAKLTAANTRGDSRKYAVKRLVDGKRDTYWSTDDNHKQADIVAEFKEPTTFNVVDIREYLPLGQRVEDWALDYLDGDQWVEFAKGKAIGNRRLWRGKYITTAKVRLRVSGPVCPALSEFGIYAEPILEKEKNAAAGLDKSAWKVVSVSGESKGGGDAYRAIDGNKKTLWNTYTKIKEIPPPHEIIVDMGKEIQIKAFTYLPRQDGLANGTVDQYAVYFSIDGKNWNEPASEGEFANIKNNPIEQTVSLKKVVKARYFKFVIKSVISHKHIAVAELGVVLAK